MKSQEESKQREPFIPKQKTYKASRPVNDEPSGEFNSSEVSSVLEMLQQSNRISVKQVQYIQIHRSVSKALEGKKKKKEDEILECISEEKPEESENRSVYSTYDRRKPSQIPQIYKGAPLLFALLGYITYGISLPLQKGVLANRRVSFLEVAALRGLFMILLGFLQQRALTIETLKIQQKNLGLLLYSMIFGAFSIIFECASLTQLNLSHFIIIFGIKPVLTSFMTFFIDGQNITRLEIISLLSSFIGVMVLTRPDLSVSPYNLNEYSLYQQEIFGITLAVISILSGGLHHSMLRKSGVKVHNTHYMITIGILTIIASSLVHPCFGLSITPVNSQTQVIGLTIIGIMTYCSQYLLDTCQQYEKPDGATLFIILTIPICFIVDSAIFKFEYGKAEIIGTIFILTFTCLNSILVLLEPSIFDNNKERDKRKNSFDYDLLNDLNKNEDSKGERYLPIIRTSSHPDSTF